MEDMRLHRLIGQQMLGDDPLEQRLIHMVIPGPVGVDNQDRAASADPETAAQRTLDPLRVPERGEPVAPRQRPEVCRQALRGLWRGTVTVLTDQDLAPVGPHARGACLLGHDRSPSTDALAPRGSVHQVRPTIDGCSTAPVEAAAQMLRLWRPDSSMGPGIVN